MIQLFLILLAVANGSAKEAQNTTNSTPTVPEKMYAEFRGGHMTWRLKDPHATKPPFKVVFSVHTSWTPGTDHLNPTTWYHNNTMNESYHERMHPGTKDITEDSVIPIFKDGVLTGTRKASLDDHTGKEVPPTVGNLGCYGLCSGKLRDVKYSRSIAGEEIGEDRFVFNFPKRETFTLGYNQITWAHLGQQPATVDDVQVAANLTTVVDLRLRGDNGKSNRIPHFLTRTEYLVAAGCPVTIHIPCVDDDGDKVTCRWAEPGEAGGLGGVSPPSLKLDKDTCTLTVAQAGVTDLVEGACHVVALQIEDFPRKAMFMKKKVDQTEVTDALSSTPFQFIMKVGPKPGDCTKRPKLVAPTPEHGAKLQVLEGDTLTVTIKAQDTVELASLQTLGLPDNARRKDFICSPNKVNGLYSMSVSIVFIPKEEDVRKYGICITAVNEDEVESEERCIYLDVRYKDPCSGQPCVNGGKCSVSGDTFKCACPGGNLNDVCMARDFCANDPCQHDGECVDDDNGVTCQCRPGWGGVDCGEEASAAGQEKSDKGTVIGAAVGGTIAVVAIAAITTMALVKRNNDAKDSAAQGAPPPEENQGSSRAGSGIQDLTEGSGFESDPQEGNMSGSSDAHGPHSLPGSTLSIRQSAVKQPSASVSMGSKLSSR